jgi:LemA protein
MVFASMGNLFIVIIALVLFLLLCGIGMANNIKRSKNQISNALSSLDALLIKRHDLIPNLIVLLKQYMSYEEDTLKKIAALRQQGITSPDKEYHQDNELNKTIKGLMIQVENYPDLKANTQFLNIQYSWNEAEEQIAAGRRFVSASITDYNNRISTFPSNIMASFIGAQKQEWQSASPEQKESPSAEKLFN